MSDNYHLAMGRTLEDLLEVYLVPEDFDSGIDDGEVGERLEAAGFKEFRTVLKAMNYAKENGLNVTEEWDYTIC